MSPHTRPDLAACAVTPHLALVGELDRRSLRYVYWKPRSGAAAAMRGGAKDLDLLIDPDGVTDARELLARLGYKRFLLPEGAAPDSEGWVAWDAGADRFYFVHLAWRIHTGLPGVHEQELPWVDALLDEARPSSSGVRVLGPEAELLCIATRAVFEPKLWDGSRRAPSDAALGAMREAGAETDREGMARLGERAFPGHGERVAALLLDAQLPEPEPWTRWRVLVRELLSHARLSAPQLEWRRAHGAATSWLGSRRRRLFTRMGLDVDPPGGRLRRDGGFLLAIIGPDGAGKSTVKDALVAWLDDLFAVESLYLGRGEWVSRAQQLAAEVKWAILERTTSRARPEPTGPADDDGRRDPHAPPKERRVRWVRDASAVALAERKRRALRRSERLRRRGWLLVTDRFPHPTEKLCDGPAIVLSAGDPVARRVLSTAERHYFRGFAGTRPDLLVRLLLPVEESVRRKPDHRAEDVRAKLAAARRARFDARASIDVAADAPLEDVLRTIKSALWEAL